MKQHVLKLVDISNEIFILMNEREDIVKVLTRHQHDWLLPLIGGKPKQRITRNRPVLDMTKSMHDLLKIMAEYSEQISFQELISITGMPRGTVSSIVHKLKTLGMVFQVKRGLYQVTEKGRCGT